MKVTLRALPSQGQRVVDSVSFFHLTGGHEIALAFHTTQGRSGPTTVDFDLRGAEQTIAALQEGIAALKASGHAFYELLDSSGQPQPVPYERLDMALGQGGYRWP